MNKPSAGVRFRSSSNIAARSLSVFILVTFSLGLAPMRVTNTVAGELDPSFGAGGTVITDFSGFEDLALALVAQSDGKILVAGDTVGPVNTINFGLARYNNDGSLDASFGSDGKVVIDFFGSFDEAFAIALQPDNKIILAGTTHTSETGNNLALARFNSDGSLDTTFGSGGKVVTDRLLRFDRAKAVALQPNGQILAGGVGIGSRGTNDFAIARFNSDGALDSSFGTGGITMSDFSISPDEIEDIALQPDGKIIAVGNARNDFAVASI
jgi:uncharacterized delta-60 repeat protein